MKRRHRPSAKIAARVAAFRDVPPTTEGVTPLNAGFFHMQRMRSGRGKTRAKHKAIQQ